MNIDEEAHFLFTFKMSVFYVSKLQTTVNFFLH